MARKLTEDKLKEILGYFKKMGVHTHCPCCYQEQWTVPDVQQDRPFFIAAGDENPDGNFTVYETFVMICAVCGYVRQHNYDAIEQGMRLLAEQGEQRIITLSKN